MTISAVSKLRPALLCAAALVGAMGCLTVAAAAASAADPWTGLYVGAAAGYGWGSSSSTIVPNAVEGPGGIGAGDPVNGPLPSNPRYNGFVGGGEVGYNARFGNFVAGLEADLSYSALHGSNTATGAPFIGGIFSTTLDARLNWFGTVRGRLGVLASNDLLVYATGGFAYGNAKTTATATNLNGCDFFNRYCLSGSTGGVSAGWAAGAGLEYAAAPGWTVKAEYLHIDLGERSVTFYDAHEPGGALTATATTRADIVRVGLNYHFSP